MLLHQAYILLGPAYMLLQHVYMLLQPTYMLLQHTYMLVQPAGIVVFVNSQTAYAQQSNMFQITQNKGKLVENEFWIF